MTGDHVAKDLRITRWKRVEREQEQLDEASRVVEQLDAAEKSILRGKARSKVKCSKSRDDPKLVDIGVHFVLRAPALATQSYS